MDRKLRRMSCYVYYMNSLQEGGQKLPNLPGTSSCLFHGFERFGRNLSGGPERQGDMIQRKGQGRINGQDVGGTYHLKPHTPRGGDRLTPRGNHFRNPQGQFDI